MPTQVQFRRGTTTQNNAFTGAAGELSVDSTLNTLRVHDGSTAGGVALVNVSSAQGLTNKTLSSPSILTSIIAGSASLDVFNTTATTLNIGGAATTISIGAATGTLTINNANTVVTGNLTVNGTTTTVNSVTYTVDDPNLELNSVASPTDVNAAGGGITLKGATDKTISWSSLGWTSSEDFNLVTGKVYEIAGTSVLSATTLGSGVTASSLTSLGTIAQLNATASSIGTAVVTNFSTGNIVATGGSINNVTVGASTATTGRFTTLTATGATTAVGAIERD
jgi:hypothetical protein